MNYFTLRNANNLSYFVCEPLERVGFINAFSTRMTGDESQFNEFTLGNFSSEQKPRVLANREKFKAALGVKDWTLVTASQIHSADIRSVQDHDDALSEPQAGDALTANLPNVLLGIQTADCLPILLADVRTRAVAAVHAGWRGTLAGILALTVARMQKEYNANPKDLCVALGPAICADNFEVGSEVLEMFRQKFSYAEKLFANFQPNGKGHIDLNRCNIEQLLEAGLRAENIFDSGFCTMKSNELFFSYRKEADHERYTGRLLSVMGRRE